MKHLTKSWMFKACNMCLALFGVLFWDRVSIILFGEVPYTEE